MEQREMPIDTVIVARAFADSKYNLANVSTKEANQLADAEYQRLITDYRENGEQSELAQRKQAVDSQRQRA
jgi:hypothetical protein